MKIVFVLSMLCLSLINIEAKNIRDFFTNENGTILEILPQNSRMDMLDYFDSGRVVYAKNALDGTCKLNAVKDNYISVQLTSASKIDMYLSSASPKDSIIIVNRTYSTPSKDGIIEFYNSNWKKIDSKKIFKAPSINDFITTPTNDSKFSTKELKEIIDIMFIYFEINPDNGNLIAKHDAEQYLSKEDFQKVKPYLKKEIRYNWTGKKYKAE